VTIQATSKPDLNEPAEAMVDARQRRLILIAMCVALTAVIASVSGLNVAQQALAVDLGASGSQLLWIINGYTVALAALLMPVGAIGDMWGRKPVLLIGLALFVFACAASALVATASALIALRVVAGIAAAMIMPVTLSVITTSFPPEERGKAVGTWAGVAGAGGIVGLFVSAAIIDNATWPWLFAFPIALALVAGAMSIAVVPRSREASAGQFDVAGSLLSVAAVGGLILAIHEGPERGWSNPFTLAALTVGVLASLLFVVVELQSDNPLIDVRLFRNRSLLSGTTNLLVAFGVMFAMFLILIQLLQAIFGYSALRAASGLLPMAIVMMPISTAGPAIAKRIGHRITVAIGMTTLAGGAVLIAILADLDSGYASIVPGLMLLGVGLGLVMSPSTEAITGSLPEAKQGVASALNDTAREFGGAVGIALFASVLNAKYRSNIGDVAETLPSELAEPVEDGIGGALQVAAQMGPDGAGLLESARQAWLDGMQPALFMCAAAAALAGLYALWSRDVSVGDTAVHAEMMGEFESV